MQEVRKPCLLEPRGHAEPRTPLRILVVDRLGQARDDAKAVDEDHRERSDEEPRPLHTTSLASATTTAHRPPIEQGPCLQPGTQSRVYTQSRHQQDRPGGLTLKV